MIPLGSTVNAALDKVKATAAAHPTLTTVGGAAAVLGATAATVAVARAASKPRKASKKKASKRRASKKRGGGKRRASRPASRTKSGHKRRTPKEDRSGTHRVKRTYRGQRVYLTKKGSPYVIVSSGPRKGRAKFIPK